MLVCVIKGLALLADILFCASEKHVAGCVGMCVCVQIEIRMCLYLYVHEELQILW